MSEEDRGHQVRHGPAPSEHSVSVGGLVPDPDLLHVRGLVPVQPLLDHDAVFPMNYSTLN